MFSKDIIKSCIVLYNKLKIDGIIGKKRIDYITNTFNIHINTLYKLINKYYNKNNNTFNFDSYSSNFKYNNLKITSQIESFVVSSINSNNNFNIKNIKNNILNKFNVKLSKTSVYYILHKNGYTYKKLNIKNNPIDENKIKELKNDLINNIDKLNNINKLYSYDEMSIYLNSKPYKGWSLKGKECFIETKNKTIFNKRFSIGMSININSDIDFTITEKALNGVKFNTFMKKINKNNNAIFLDNASIHKNKQFINDIKKNNWNVIYNIPYHSHLNPIEYVFSLLRKELLNNDVKTFNDIVDIIVRFKKNLNKDHVKNIFNKCLREIKIV